MSREVWRVRAPYLVVLDALVRLLVFHDSDGLGVSLDAYLLLTWTDALQTNGATPRR